MSENNSGVFSYPAPAEHRSEDGPQTAAPQGAQRRTTVGGKVYFGPYYTPDGQPYYVPEFGPGGQANFQAANANAAPSGAEQSFPPPQYASPAYAPPYTPPYTPPYATPVAKPGRFIYDFSAGDRIFGLVIFILTYGLFTAISSFFDTGFNGLATLFFSAFAVAAPVYTAKKGVKPTLYGILCLLSALLASGVFFTSTDYLAQLMTFPLLFVLIVTGASDTAGCHALNGDFAPAKLFFKKGFGDTFTGLIPGIASFFSGKKNKKAPAGVIVGIICALPVVIVLTSLLKTADAAFQGLTEAIFGSFSVNILRLFATLLFAPFICSFCYRLKKHDQTCVDTSAREFLPVSAVAAFLSVVSLCYVVYLVSQLSYYFSAFAGLLPADFEAGYAAYAKRGFNELIAVGVINLLLIFLTAVFTKKPGGRLALSVKIPSVFIGVFTLLLAGINFAKMKLYVENYGMTEKRIWSTALTLFIAIVFIALIIRIFTNKAGVLKTALVTASLIFALLGLVNVRSFCADYNYKAFADGRLSTVDVAYIENLGPEGVPVLVKLAECGDKDVSSDALIALARSYNKCFDPDTGEKTCRGTALWNIPVAKMYEAIDEYGADKIAPIARSVREKEGLFGELF